MAQKGTLTPSSCETAMASAVLPVPGGPASRSARPEKRDERMRWVVRPQAWQKWFTNRSLSVGFQGKGVGLGPSSHLPSLDLADKAGCGRDGVALLGQTEALAVAAERDEPDGGHQLRVAASQDGERATRAFSGRARARARSLARSRVGKRRTDMCECVAIRDDRSDVVAGVTFIA
jgi:hypothetical protein